MATIEAPSPPRRMNGREVAGSMRPCPTCRRTPAETRFGSCGEGYRAIKCSDCARDYMRVYMRKRNGTPQARPCAQCGKDVFGSRRVFCSSACVRAARRTARQLRVALVEECPLCGSDFHPYGVRNGRKKFCSAACSTQAQKAYKYGLTAEEYRLLRDRAAGCCEMCGVAFEEADNSFTPWAPSADRHAIDHCHETGLVRGLLCGGCNVYLGHYEKIRENAERYLAAHGARGGVQDRCA